MTISELAVLTGVSAHTLRYYERMGLVPMVERDRSSGHRRYGPRHAQWIAFLRNLRECGMPIRDVRAYAKLVAKGDGSWPERREMLATHRRRVVAAIARLQEHQAVLDGKLALGCAPAGLHMDHAEPADMNATLGGEHRVTHASTTHSDRRRSRARAGQPAPRGRVDA